MKEYKWEIVDPDEFVNGNAVRRMSIPQGWLYQVQTGWRYSSRNDTSTAEYGVPVFVPGAV